MFLYYNRIYRFWNNTATSNSEDLGFSVYPNPFFTGQHGILNGEGHVRFIFYNSNNLDSQIDIYDFGMRHVISIKDKINIDNESIIIWDGRNTQRNKVINGTYFCKLSIDSKVYWTKLLVIN